MTSDASVFSTIDIDTQLSHIHTTYGTYLDVTQCKTIARATNPFGWLTISTVFVVPSLCMNLIFISCLSMLGLRMIFSLTCVVQDSHTDRAFGVGSGQGTIIWITCMFHLLLLLLLLRLSLLRLMSSCGIDFWVIRRARDFNYSLFWTTSL